MPTHLVVPKSAGSQGATKLDWTPPPMAQRKADIHGHPNGLRPGRGSRLQRPWPQAKPTREQPSPAPPTRPNPEGFPTNDIPKKEGGNHSNLLKNPAKKKRGDAPSAVSLRSTTCSEVRARAIWEQSGNSPNKRHLTRAETSSEDAEAGIEGKRKNGKLGWMVQCGVDGFFG